LILLVSVTPAAHVPQLKACGFRSEGGRRNKYTMTLVRQYPDATLAKGDGYRLPDGCVWGIEEEAN